MKVVAVLGCVLLVTGCGRLSEAGREPAMTPIGSGLYAPVQNFPGSAPAGGARNGMVSLWDDSRGDLFRDPRASKVGDVITVSIAINDRASMGNSTDRSQEAKASTGFSAGTSLGPGAGYAADGSLNIDSKSSAAGKGNIDRAEKIQLSIAAVVTDVMPNGNLLISGSQEVRVNYELRLLNIAGVVRPRDISRDNLISYEKIAEARISYGGRGRVSEVQQPAYGHQIYDIIKPF
ncbi:MAG: flagellar basal body L-ring protein FlgH [Beijerinckiaceae bacterium]|jgi:flagellar L-ring protein FlgH|nr:flagellar basal body L-ring protein FlgH [Beijerinckiaceae bacterium]